MRVKVLTFREILEGERLWFVRLKTLGTNQTVAVPWWEGGVALAAFAFALA